MSSLYDQRPLSIRLLAAAAATVIGAVVLAAPADAGHRAPHSAKAADTLKATLRGSNEVPGPGDPNGRGSVTIRLHAGTGKVCAHASWKRIGTPNAAHIHKGAAGVSGDVVVDLTSAVTGGPHCVTHVRAGVIRKLAAHPGRYYFNIHTGAYLAGAIRGQLHG